MLSESRSTFKRFFILSIAGNVLLLFLKSLNFFILFTFNAAKSKGLVPKLNLSPTSLPTALESCNTSKSIPASFKSFVIASL